MATRVQLRGDRGLATRSSAGASTVEGFPFVATATITSTAAGTAVSLKPDTAIPAGSKVYVTNFVAKVNGGTAWSGGSNTIVTIQDTNGTPVVFSTIAVAALTGNAELRPGTSNVTSGAAFYLGTGGTAGCGLVVKGDANAGAGSDLTVTVSGLVK